MSDSGIIHQLMRSGKPLTWLFTGDSITQGALHTYGWRSFTEHFAERIRFELGRPLDYVINTGISGHTANEIIDQFERRVGQFKPEIVFLMIGTNDAVKGQPGLASFKANISKIIDLIRQNNSIPIINTPNPILTEVASGVSRTRLWEYTEVMREISHHKNVILIDHWKHWEAAKPDKDAMMSWLADSIHPNAYGHIEIAKEIFRTLGIYDMNSTVCKFFTP